MTKMVKRLHPCMPAQFCDLSAGGLAKACDLPRTAKRPRLPPIQALRLGKAHGTLCATLVNLQNRFGVRASALRRACCLRFARMPLGFFEIFLTPRIWFTGNRIPDHQSDAVRGLRCSTGLRSRINRQWRTAVAIKRPRLKPGSRPIAGQMYAFLLISGVSCRLTPCVSGSPKAAGGCGWNKTGLRRSRFAS